MLNNIKKHKLSKTNPEIKNEESEFPKRDFKNILLKSINALYGICSVHMIFYLYIVTFIGSVFIMIIYSNDSTYFSEPITLNMLRDELVIRTIYYLLLATFMLIYVMIMILLILSEKFKNFESRILYFFIGMIILYINYRNTNFILSSKYMFMSTFTIWLLVISGKFICSRIKIIPGIEKTYLLKKGK